MGVPLGHHVEKKARSPSVIVFAGIEIDQFEIGPVMQAWPFGSLA
jgi:hypothetical protein